MDRLYEPGAYGHESDAGNYWRTTVAQPSFPTAQGDISCEFVVIGAGFTGLSAALHLINDNAADVVVLDAETPGWGASGRNGGFACLGGAKQDPKKLRQRFGDADLRRYQTAERAAVDLVAQMLEQHGIDADTHSKGETLLAHRAGGMARLRQAAEQFTADFGVPVDLLEPEQLGEHGMAGPQFHGAMTIPIGFALNPLKYATGLANAVSSAGARIFSDSAVLKIEPTGDGFVLTTAQARIHAKKLLLATNGYTSEDVPGWMAGRFLPVQSSVLVTRPITAAEQADQGWTTGQMAYDTRHLLHYFRLMPNGRFLFGMRGGVHADKAAFAEMKQAIRQDFEDMFPAWAHIETPHFWAGLVCMSRNLTPYVGPLGDWSNAYAGFAYHGNGVAMGSYCGALMADLATGRTSTRVAPDFMQAPLRKFPFGKSRRLLLRGAYHWYQFLDRG